MKGISLTEARDIVTAQLKRAEDACGNYADDPRNWHSRHWIIMKMLAELLTHTTAARITTRDGSRVIIAGVTASSTAGIAAALKNWLTAAERRIAQ